MKFFLHTSEAYGNWNFFDIHDIEENKQGFISQRYIV